MTASPPTRAPRAAPRRSALGGTLIGVFIGIVVGLGLAATVAYWVMRNNPALSMPSFARPSADATKDAAAKGAKASPDKLDLGFYKILPGVEEPKVQPERRAERSDRSVVGEAKERSLDKSGSRTSVPVDAPPARSVDKAAPMEATPKTAKAADRAWLQAGSFSAPPDAENLRARLALAGWEATVQEGALADSSVRYRVRLGPYDNPDELRRIKSELAKRGFDVTVIH
ncbi:MAG: SPOR domain-containing protein [Betaproteobacteria bacterium]